MENKNIMTTKTQDILELPVIGFGETRDPIVRADDGIVLFIKDVVGHALKKDERVKIRVTRVLERYGFAELV